MRDQILLAFRINAPAMTENRVYFWQGVVALRDSFPNVNLDLVNLPSGAEDTSLSHTNFGWLFFNQFCAQKMSDIRGNEVFWDSK